MLSEFGIIFSLGRKAFLEGLAEFIKDDYQSLRLRTMMGEILYEYQYIVKRIEKIEKELIKFVKECPNGKILMSIPGLGYINASALLAAIDKGQAFKNAREFAVWLGLTPKQYASGTTSHMGGITKRGDRYLRKQLVHGARTVVSNVKNKTDRLSLWASSLLERKSFNKVAVAMAHRLARLIWILLQRQELYKPQFDIDTATAQ